MSERNGSTEPPTEPGWYWFEGEEQLQDGRWIELGKALCFVPRQLTPSHGVYACVFEWDVMPDQAPIELPLTAMHGAWYGPLQPPWEPQQ